MLLESSSDVELIARLHALLARDRRTTVELVCHLGEIDRRKLYLAQAHSSMFSYCTDALHMSEDVAYLRIQAARLARRFPAVLDALASGALHLSGLKLLGPELTDDNHRELLASCAGKSKRDIEKLLATRAPQPQAPPSIRKVAVVRPAASAPSTSAPLPLFATPQVPELPPPVHAPAPSADCAPEACAYRFAFTASQSLHDTLRQAQELLRHQLPDGDVPAIIERALVLLVEELRRRRFGLTRKEAAHGQRAGSQSSRTIARAVRREVYRRDGGRCTYESGEGQRCSATGMLEYHHVVPFACGGPSTVDNLRLMCAAHNRYQAEVDFGAELIARRRREHQLVPDRVSAEEQTKVQAAASKHKAMSYERMLADEKR